MPEEIPDRAMTPNEQLLFDIETEEVMANASGDAAPSPEEDLKASEAVRAFLRLQGLPVAPEEALLTPGSVYSHWQALKLEPIPTIAAADDVRSIVAWEGGTIRFLQSPMASDLAVELVVDDARRSDFESVVFFVEISGMAPPVALFAGHSPVFTGVEPEVLVRGGALTLWWAPVGDLDRESLPALKRAQRNLRDPSGSDWYESVIRSIAGA